MRPPCDWARLAPDHPGLCVDTLKFRLAINVCPHLDVFPMNSDAVEASIKAIAEAIIDKVQRRGVLELAAEIEDGLLIAAALECGITERQLDGMPLTAVAEHKQLVDAYNLTMEKFLNNVTDPAFASADVWKKVDGGTGRGTRAGRTTGRQFAQTVLKRRPKNRARAHTSRIKRPVVQVQSRHAAAAGMVQPPSAGGMPLLPSGGPPRLPGHGLTQQFPGVAAAAHTAAPSSFSSTLPAPLAAPAAAGSALSIPAAGPQAAAMPSAPRPAVSAPSGVARAFGWVGWVGWVGWRKRASVWGVSLTRDSRW